MSAALQQATLITLSPLQLSSAIDSGRNFSAMEQLVENYFNIIEFEDDDEFREIDQQIHGENPNLENTDAGMNDTTASEFRNGTDIQGVPSEFRNGTDIQGVPWERSNYTRDMYREIRLKGYKNYENVLWYPNKHGMHGGEDWEQFL